MAEQHNTDNGLPVDFEAGGYRKPKLAEILKSRAKRKGGLGYLDHLLADAANEIEEGLSEKINLTEEQARELFAKVESSLTDRDSRLGNYLKKRGIGPEDLEAVKKEYFGEQDTP